MAKQMAFYMNSSICSRCKACQIACVDQNNLQYDVRYRRILPYEGGSWTLDPNDKTLWKPTGVFSYGVSEACMHCQDPICVKVCPTGASIKRSDGVVYIDQNICIGCRYCEWACPYGSRHFNEATGTMGKCDFCRDRIDSGKNPACVDACPMRALDYGELSELQAKYGFVNAVEPLPRGDITNPSVVITPHKHAQFSGKGTGKYNILPEEA
jgi:anaerobic dimethyl sulfoxide reductase subunit B